MLVFFGPGTAAQIVVAVILCLFAIKGYSYYEPYEDTSDDRLAEASQWVLFAVLFTAFLIQVDVAKEDKQDQERLGIILVVLTLLPMVYASGLAVYDLRSTFQSVKSNTREACEKAKRKSLELELGSIYPSAGRSRAEGEGHGRTAPAIQVPSSSAEHFKTQNPMVAPKIWREFDDKETAVPNQHAEVAEITVTHERQPRRQDIAVESPSPTLLEGIEELFDENYQAPYYMRLSDGAVAWTLDDLYDPPQESQWTKEEYDFI